MLPILANIALNNATTVDISLLKELNAVLTKEGQPSEELISAIAEREKMLNVDTPAADIAAKHSSLEKTAEDYADCEELEKAETIINSGIHYKDSSLICTPRVVAVMLAEYIKVWDRCSSLIYNEHLIRGEHFIRSELSSVNIMSDPGKLTISALCDEMIDDLDREDLVTLLASKLQGRDYRYILLPYCRFASEQKITQLIGDINRLKKGRAKERYWAENAAAALNLSDTRAAVEYMEKHKQLCNYAHIRKMDEKAFRLKYLYDFELDEKDQKFTI